MISMVILALSICSLFEFSLLATVIFTAIFSICGYAAVIYFKLKFEFCEEECDMIRKYIGKARRILNNIKRCLGRKKAHSKQRQLSL